MFDKEARPKWIAVTNIDGANSRVTIPPNKRLFRERVSGAEVTLERSKHSRDVTATIREKGKGIIYRASYDKRHFGHEIAELGHPKVKGAKKAVKSLLPSRQSFGLLNMVINLHSRNLTSRRD